MEKIIDHLYQLSAFYLKEQHHFELSKDLITLTPTRTEFEGDLTLVVFGMAGKLRMPPQQLAEELGQRLSSKSSFIEEYNVIKGFLNLTFTASFWNQTLARISDKDQLIQPTQSGKIVLEYGSPNSNKPLHLGHMRNLLLGYAVGQLLQTVGYDVHFTQIVNDRGIAICKTMVSWLNYYEGVTPQSIGVKPDHFIGEVYVRFSKEVEAEYLEWQRTDEANSEFSLQDKYDTKEAFFKAYKNEYFNTYSDLGAQARQLLLKWEANDTETRALWQRMNDWFLEGYEETTNRLGITFDSSYFESVTYLIGRDLVLQGLQKGLFEQDADGSIWVDLTEEGLDRKILLRSDGTTVYITQDLGTAQQRYQDIGMNGMIYTVGNEQDYHFQVLFKTLAKLGEPYADLLYHLSYGMVELPDGKMKTREGNVVDADHLIEEVYEQVRSNAASRGELSELNEEERSTIFEHITLGAIKYYMLRVDAKKSMLFNPVESVDLQGQTGPYIQNAYVRIQSIKRRMNEEEEMDLKNVVDISAEERALLIHLLQYQSEIYQAAKSYDPAILAQYLYQLARLYHRFYQAHRIIQEDQSLQTFRYKLSSVTGGHLLHGMSILGITMPERM